MNNYLYRLYIISPTTMIIATTRTPMLPPTIAEVCAPSLPVLFMGWKIIEWMLFLYMPYVYHMITDRVFSFSSFFFYFLTKKSFNQSLYSHYLNSAYASYLMAGFVETITALLWTINAKIWFLACWKNVRLSLHKI